MDYGCQEYQGRGNLRNQKGQQANRRAILCEIPHRVWHVHNYR
jgi:hypothetical protein